MNNKINNKIIEEFNKLVKQIQYDIDHEKDKNTKLKHSFRLQSVKKALQIIENFPDKITSSVQLKDIPGIGKGTLDRIDEILQTGKLSEIKIDINEQQYLNYVNELEELFGIGKVKAYELYEKYGITSIKELKDLYEKKKIDLPDNIVAGLKYYDLIKDKIPREEMDQIDTFLHTIIPQIDTELFGIICGSYRRLRPTSNDIDMLLVHPSIKTKNDKNNKNDFLARFINKLKEVNFIVQSLTSDNVQTKYMGLCQYKNNPIRRIDIRFIPYESYYTAILYFTGSSTLNKQMRKIADSLGYTLNEYGLYDNINKKQFIINSEKDVFDELGLDYLSPEQRSI